MSNHKYPNLKMNTDFPKPPVYDDKETVIAFTRRFTEYLDQVTKIKYNVILDFINIWLQEYNIKIRRLIDFKQIKRSVIMDNKKHNRKILKLYTSKIYKYFKIDDSTFDTIDTDDIDEDEIIILLKHILSKIDYALLKRKNDEDEIVYSIYMKNKKYNKDSD